MRRWKILTILMLLILIPIGMACKQRYDINEEVLIYDIIESDGDGASCNLTLFKGGVFNQSNFMNRTGLSYEYNASKLTKETYSASIECNISTSTYLGECKFDVGVNEKQMIAIMIGLGLCLIFFIYLAWVFKREFDGIHREWLAPVKFIFISLAYFMMMGILRVGIELLKDNGKTGLANIFNSLWITLMVIFSFIFFIVMFMYGIRFLMGIVERKKWGE